MSLLITETPEGLSLHSEIAGPGSRALASILDLFLFMGMVIVFFYIAAMVSFAVPELGESLMVWVAMGVGLAMMFFQVVCAFLMRGVTLGKLLVGLVVVDAAGFPATLFQHLVRGLFWPLEMLPFPLPIGIMCMAGSLQQQRLGDRVAGTYVLRLPPKSLPADPYVKVHWTQLSKRRLKLVPAHASRFDERDLSFLRKLIGRQDVDASKYQELLRRALAHYLKLLDFEIKREPSEREARAVLSELYVFLRHMRARS